MKPLLPLLLAAALLAVEPPADDLNRLDARELHNRGTRRLAEGDLAGAEESLRASLGRDIDELRTPALHNLGHVRFGKGLATLGGKTTGDVTELSIARSYLEAADADIADMQDQITLLDRAKAAGRTPDYVPAVAALGQGIDTYRTVKKLLPKEEAMLAKRAGVVAAWTRSVGDFRGAHELDPRDADSRANADAIDELLRALERETRQLADAVAAQRRKQDELREVIKELIKRIPDDKLPQNAEGDGDDDENFLPEDRQKPGSGGGKREPKSGEEQKMTEQEARGALEGLKNEFGRKMPAGEKPGADGEGKAGKPNAKKGKDY
jgi:tetratricopeptide (TPR) repeat protein